MNVRTMTDDALEADYATAHQEWLAARDRMKAFSDELGRRQAARDLEREIARLGDDKLAAIVQHVTGAGGLGSEAAVGTPGAR